MKARVKSHRGVPTGSPHIVCESYVRTCYVHIRIEKQDSYEKRAEERGERREERLEENKRRENKGTNGENRQG